jgi:hypothetical protein
MKGKSDNEKTGFKKVGFTGGIAGRKVFEGVLDTGALWDTIVKVMMFGFTRILAELPDEDMPRVLRGGYNYKKKWNQADRARITSEFKEYAARKRETYRLLDEGEEPEELTLTIQRAILYVEANIDSFAEEWLRTMIFEAMLAARPISDTERPGRVDDQIAGIVDENKRSMKKRVLLSHSILSPITEAKIRYATNYPLLLERWQEAEEIYNNWLAEIKKIRDKARKDDNLKSEEWKRRIKSQCENMPDDLLHRLVRDQRSPCFTSDIDEYHRTPSRIAAIHTAWLCGLPDNLSYETYMRIRREGGHLLSVTESTQNDDTDLSE